MVRVSSLVSTGWGHQNTHGGVAHLVERLAGSQEVVSSILIASTKKYEMAY